MPYETRHSTSCFGSLVTFSMLLCCWTKVTGNITSGGLQWTVGMYWYTSNSLLRPSRGAEYCDQPVCLSVSKRIHGTAGLIATKFSVQIPCGCGLVLFRWRCATLCTSGFMDDVTFGRSWQYGVAWLAWYTSRQLRARPGRSLMSTNELIGWPAGTLLIMSGHINE